MPVRAVSGTETLLGEGSLKCDGCERYLWFWEMYRGEKIGSAEDFQVDFSTLDGAGLALNATCFDIKIFHQGDTAKILSQPSRQGKNFAIRLQGLKILFLLSKALVVVGVPFSMNS